MHFAETEVHHLRAAEGWLELGNTREAEAELNDLGASFQKHPAVLELRWQIEARARHWKSCIEIARTITQLAPDVALGWIHLSYALHEVKRTGEAWDNLIAVVDSFPEEPTMRYNLACYACQLGDMPAARGWLKKALALGRKEETKEMALQDLDLKPLWPEIEVM